MRRPRKYALAAVLACLGGTLTGCTSSTTGLTSPSTSMSSATASATPSPSVSSPTTAASPTPAATTRPPTRHPTATPVARAACLRVVTMGYSVRHRAITACERGTPGGVALVVVGEIHGDERIGWRVVDLLMTATVPAGVDLWLVRSVNPDGAAVGTRSNAHGVDENRNFPAGWVASTPASATYGGPRPLSEPETSALARWLQQLEPRTVVIMHSPLAAVDFSVGADPAVTRYLASASGFPARTLGARPGSLTGWFNALSWHGTAITFEFARTASAAQVSRVSRALLQLAHWRQVTA